MRRHLFDGLRPGDHLCAIHESDEERLQALDAFFRCSLEAGNKCIYFHGHPSDEDALAALRSDGFDPASYCHDGRIKLFAVNSDFDSSVIRSLSQEHASGDDGSIRVAMDASAIVPDGADAASLTKHAVRINEIVSGAGIVCICLYDRRIIPPSSLVALIDSHPLVSLGTQVFHNCRFPSGVCKGSGDGGEAELQARLDGLRRDHQR
jgi:hypothetical protein